MGSRSKSDIASDNRDTGQNFETLFLKQARRCGLLALKNHLTAKMIGNGHMKVVKSELDYKLINQKGRIGYFDCKSFAGDSFRFSDLKQEQIDRAILYNEWEVPSGFVVYLRGDGNIFFFSGFVIDLKGKGNSFEAADGKKLGPWYSFDLAKVLDY